MMFFVRLAAVCLVAVEGTTLAASPEMDCSEHARKELKTNAEGGNARAMFEYGFELEIGACGQKRRRGREYLVCKVSQA